MFLKLFLFLQRCVLVSLQVAETQSVRLMKANRETGMDALIIIGGHGAFTLEQAPAKFRRLRCVSYRQGKENPWAGDSTVPSARPPAIFPGKIAVCRVGWHFGLPSSIA